MDQAPVESHSDPVEVFLELQRRLADEDYLGAVELIHDGLIKWLADTVRRAASQPVVTAEQMTPEYFLELEPDMPPEVARYQAERLKGTGPGPSVPRDPYELKDVDDLGVFSLHQLAVKALRGGDHRRGWREYIDNLVARYPEHREHLLERRGRGPPPLLDGTVAGSVITGDRAFVVFYFNRAPIERLLVDFPPQTATLWRTPHGWRLASDPVPGYGMMMRPLTVPDGHGGEIELS